ncbi:MAG: hypothetical protein NVS9B4_02620 [Candidatus Acidiferrum sp.]
MASASPSPASPAGVAHPFRKPLLALLRFAFGTAILIYLFHTKTIDPRILTKLVSAWRITLVAMAVLLVDLLLMSERACLLFKPQGLRLTLADSFRLSLLGLFFSTFLPGASGGDVAKLFYATKEHAGQRAKIVTVLIFDRAIGFFSMLVLPFFFVPLFLPLIRSLPSLRHVLWVIAYLSLGTLGVLLLAVFNRPLQSLLSKDSLIPARWRTLARNSLSSLETYQRSPGALLAALLISLLANLSVIAITALAVLLLNPAGLASRMCLIIPIGHVINGIPLTPGGLGVGEAAFNALFKMTGLQSGAETLFIWRIWKTSISLLGFAVYLRGMGTSLFENIPDKSPRSRATSRHTP